VFAMLHSQASPTLLACTYNIIVGLHPKQFKEENNLDIGQERLLSAGRCL